jgi:hypothetical protein
MCFERNAKTTGATKKPALKGPAFGSLTAAKNFHIQAPKNPDK